MHIKDRQFIERAIAKAALTSLINEGFFITIYDGEEFVEPFFSKDVEALMKVMFSTDKVYRTAVAAGRVADSARRAGIPVIILPVPTGYIIVRTK